MNYWPLLGVAVVVAGFAMKRNAVLVVVAAGVASALAAGMTVGDLLALLGNSFVSNRALLLFTLTLPVIGLLERHGLRERAKAWIEGFEGLSLARLLIAYLGLRQLLAMFGLIDLGGHAQTVRPLLAPMSEAAAARRGMRGDERLHARTAGATDEAPSGAPIATELGRMDALVVAPQASVHALKDDEVARAPSSDEPMRVRARDSDEFAHGGAPSSDGIAHVRALSNDELARVRALAAATDNIGRFFGEDVFLAFGAVLLIQGFYERNGIHLEPFAIALWALPTAICAFLIHSIRIVYGQRVLRAAARGPMQPASAPSESSR